MNHVFVVLEKNIKNVVVLYKIKAKKDKKINNNPKIKKSFFLDFKISLN